MNCIVNGNTLAPAILTAAFALARHPAGLVLIGHTLYLLLAKRWLSLTPAHNYVDRKN